MNLQNSQPSSPPAQRELVRIRRFAQITVPESFREHFSVREGDYVEAEMLPTGLLLKPVTVMGRDRAWGEIFSSMKTVKSAPRLRKEKPRAQEELIVAAIKTKRKEVRK